MSSDRHASKPPTSADGPDPLVRYVLDEMSLSEQVAFEHRLAEDPELAREVEAVVLLDELLHRASQREAELARRQPKSAAGRRVALLAACVALAVGAVWWALREEPLPVTVAIARSAPSYAGLLAELGVAPGEAPREVMRGGDPPSPGDGTLVDDLLEHVQRDVARALSEEADSQSSEEVRGEAFVVPFASDREVWVAVVGTFEDGTLQLYHPAERDLEAARRHGTYAPGRHVLPRARVQATPEQRERGEVEFAPGFVVPLGRERVVVHVLVQARAPSADSWRRLLQVTRRGSVGEEAADALRRALPEASMFEFSVRTN